MVQLGLLHYKRKLGRCELLNEKEKADFDIELHNSTKPQSNLAILLG